MLERLLSANPSPHRWSQVLIFTEGMAHNAYPVLNGSIRRSLFFNCENARSIQHRSIMIVMIFLEWRSLEWRDRSKWSLELPDTSEIHKRRRLTPWYPVSFCER